ncbi:MAG: GAF domain-containing sensor histidine kinase [Gemmatimonadota bacterium]|nr:GAF domain-containing sensor histidine kinase [Gemmatimonadota bacterium]MDH3367381.1 GAF domain-containing sensor histidine kinase [Gemmatimonadota bacterium]MDH3477596.1 GAF domain-containing sensor histidine kinase [Gemmatimonadota bacterium]MDH3568749.1 GAF domain-containing sensor histidine kinase [Gemmatimonadota bacterium]
MSADMGRREIWHRAEQLCRAGIRIASVHELDAVLTEVVESARAVIGSRFAALGVLHADGDHLERFITSGIGDAEKSRLGGPPSGHGILGLLITDPHPIRLKDLTKHPKFTGMPKQHAPMRSFLGVPIHGRERPIGNLYLTEKIGAEEFSEEDEKVAVMLAAYAAVAVENARFHQDRERLLAELRGMHDSRERFYAMTNHELRNALTAVHGWAELWVRKTAPDTPRAAIEVQESAERALNLLEDLLDLSRLDADKLEPKLIDADAWNIVRESVATVEPAAERKGIAVRVTGPDGTIDCRTDPQRVRQILINLLTNAVRHSPQDDTIDVKVRASNGEMRFDVVDHGEGIAPEQQAIIFEAFERAGKQTERGTGLGLALSRKLARLLGGDLRVESQLGHGAHFSLNIPRFADASS